MNKLIFILSLLYYIFALVDNKKPMTYGQKVGRFCIKSGPLTGRKRAVNSMKENECNLINVHSYEAYNLFRLKGKAHKTVTIFSIFFLGRLMHGDMADIKKQKICMSKSREN